MSNKPIKNYPGIVPPVGYKLNPFSNNWIYCPEGKMINPATGRCVSKDSRTLTKTVAQQIVEAVIPSMVAPTVKPKVKPTVKPRSVLSKIIENQMITLSKLGNTKRRKSIEASIQKQLKDMKRRYTA